MANGSIEFGKEPLMRRRKDDATASLSKVSGGTAHFIGVIGDVFENIDVKDSVELLGGVEVCQGAEARLNSDAGGRSSGIDTRIERSSKLVQETGIRFQAYPPGNWA